VVIARRWVVERTFAWLGRCRRLAKDFEATIASAVADLRRQYPTAHPKARKALKNHDITLGQTLTDIPHMNPVSGDMVVALIAAPGNVEHGAGG